MAQTQEGLRSGIVCGWSREGGVIWWRDLFDLYRAVFLASVTGSRLCGAESLCAVIFVRSEDQLIE